MKSRETEYKELFLAEAREEFDAMNRNIIALEKHPEDDKLVSDMFRLLHNLKANAKATGYISISQLSHKLESVFGAIRNKELRFESTVAEVLFESIDTLGRMLQEIDDPEAQQVDPRLDRNLDNILEGNGGGEVEVTSQKHYHTAQNIAISELVYIPIRKLDNLLNLVGELIIDRDRILSISKETDNDALKGVGAHLDRIANAIQLSVMDARLVNIGYLFNKFPRIVRDVAVVEGKDVELEISGQDIQIDRNILQILTDSMLHIVRNAITHGIESPEKRQQLGKPAAGQLALSAQSDKDTVHIKIQDDGKGIDVEKVREFAVKNRYVSADKAGDLNKEEVLSFIFEPGFSLASNVTEIAGRGVGLDVVKTAIDTLGGRITVSSKVGEGTSFNLYVPTSIAVKAALLFEVDGMFYAIPLIHTEAVVTYPVSDVHQIGSAMMASIKGETLPLLDMKDLFSGVLVREMTELRYIGRSTVDIVIVTYNNRKLGLIVDRLLRQQDIVVKPLQKPVDNVELFGGVTLLGGGEICLVLDVPSISRRYVLRGNAPVHNV